MTSTRVLVNVAWLREHLDDPNVRVVEVDVDTALYAKGHVPGAVGWSWTTDLNDPVRRDVVQKREFEALLSRAGITPSTTVVLYGDHHNWFAAFGAWLLRYYGHEDVRLLDGGRRAWEEARHPLVADEPSHAPTAYRVTNVRQDLRATRELVLHAATRGGPALIDVRSPDEFTGKVLAPPGLSETAQRGGHIPGARNVPWAKAVKEDGTFRPIEELRALYRPDESNEFVTYCRIGERSSHTWFVLHEILGHPRVRNYDGSWTEYGNLIGAPVAVGAEP